MATRTFKALCGSEHIRTRCVFNIPFETKLSQIILLTIPLLFDSYYLMTLVRIQLLSLVTILNYLHRLTYRNR